MPDMIRLILFIFVAISSIFSLIQEFKKPQKSLFWISFEFLLLVGMIILITEILV
ncbi:hypothetical protein [Bacillus paranthracis]|uniref:hypothetical protein n=1 Tax=Bacillus paranthracis TaxID=2026186 RepID=UPI00164371BE|nr:hypothetical protein [Bacillus paranthracis]